MQVLEKILEEIEQRKARAKKLIVKPPHDKLDQVANETAEAFIEAYKECQDIIRKQMNDGWIPVDEKPKKDYETVFAVDKNDYYFVAVYDKYHGFRSNDIGADVDNIVAYCLFNPYRPERSEGE
mgnify:CR=1 FL=1